MLIAKPDTRPWLDSPVSRARLLTLVWLASSVLSVLVLPLVGLVREPALGVRAAGLLGIALFFCAQTYAVWSAVTPWAPDPRRRQAGWAFGASALLSVPLVAPVAAGEWPTWAWLAAAVVGTTPLLWSWRTVLAVGAGATAASAAVALASDGSAVQHVVITASVGGSIALINWAPLWLWELLVRAESAKATQAQLVAAEERLRFARDVHDVLGHDLTVIALKAELASRSAGSAPETAARESEEVRRLAESALDRVRSTAAGYREVNFAAEVDGVAHLLSMAGVRCEAALEPCVLPRETATRLSAILKEATTNVLRHSHARTCRIATEVRDGTVLLTVTNDGAHAYGADERSSGLEGMRERLAERGGTLSTHHDDGVFELRAELRVEA